MHLQYLFDVSERVIVRMYFDKNEHGEEQNGQSVVYFLTWQLSAAVLLKPQIDDGDLSAAFYCPFVIS